MAINDKSYSSLDELPDLFEETDSFRDGGGRKLHFAADENYFMTIPKVINLDTRESFDIFSEIPGMPQYVEGQATTPSQLLRSYLLNNVTAFSVANGTTMLARNKEGDFFKVNLKKRTIKEVTELAPHKEMFARMYDERWLLFKAYKERYLYF